MMILMLAACKSDDDTGTSNESNSRDVQTLCMYEKNDETARKSYAYVVKGGDCCKSSPSKEYPAAAKTYERRGTAWALLSTESIKASKAQSLGCDLENARENKVTITEGNTEFVNAVLRTNMGAQEEN